MSINNHNTHILPKFEYYSPKNIEEACKILSELPEDSKILAGGTDLIPKMKEGVLKPKNIINIKQIQGLSGIQEKDNCIIIGANTKIRDIEKNLIIQKKADILHQATKKIGSVQIRNIATIGGNICNASPAADGVAALIALNAEISIIGVKKKKTIKLEAFFKGPGKTILNKEEILTEIKFPVPEPGSYGYYCKLGRVSLDLATVSLAVQLKMVDEKVENIIIVSGSVAPTPLRLYNIENLCINKKITNDLIDEVAEKISREIKPISDTRASADYRYLAIKGLAKEAFSQILEKSRGTR
ncbi:xanthine dehydrogenase family protein subunit M [Candidatus Bathyarchaeota archaeon]|nr:xanthine dehydrogenase family protein subunit M [Candidatus Bathyarchaeota archaeon]